MTKASWLPRHRAARVIAVGASIALLALGGCRAAQREAADATAGTEVHVETVGTSAENATFEATGTVRSKFSAVLSSKIVGQVLAVTVREGDRVTAGQLLVEIEARDAQAGLARAQGALGEARHAVDEVERSIRAAESAKTAAEANQRLAAVTQQRYKQLLDTKDISQQEFDEVDARYKAASADVQSASDNIDALRARREMVHSRVAQAEADVENAKVAIGYARVTAPTPGVVSRRSVDPGALASPGTPLVTIDDDRTLRLEAIVEEGRAGAVAIGRQATVYVDALGGEPLNGTVAEINPTSDASSRSFVARIDLPPDPRLRPGLFGRAVFPIGAVDVITVPRVAVVERGQTSTVFVVEGEGTARLRFVTTGKAYGDRVEVLTGLSKGDRVITRDVAQLADGARVRVAPGA